MNEEVLRVPISMAAETFSSMLSSEPDKATLANSSMQAADRASIDPTKNVIVRIFAEELLSHQDQVSLKNQCMLFKLFWEASNQDRASEILALLDNDESVII